MKRRLFKLALFLIIGAIVNVAVAWGFGVSMKSGMSDPQERIGGSMDGPDHSLWIIFEHRTPGRVRILASWNDPGVGGGLFGGWPDDPADPLVPEWAPLSLAFLRATRPCVS